MFALDYLTHLVCFPSLFYEGGSKLECTMTIERTAASRGAFRFAAPRR